MKQFFNYVWEHGSLLIRRLCGLVWGAAGVFCLFTAYRQWQYLSAPQAFHPLGKGTEVLMIAVVLLLAVLFLLYGAVQMTRERDHALARLFQKKVPNGILVILAYAVFIFVICSFTMGEVALKSKYAVPLQIGAAVLLILDLFTNLGLFPDQWESSPLIRLIARRSRKK